jgi:hypothetical protein
MRAFICSSLSPASRLNHRCSIPGDMTSMLVASFNAVSTKLTTIRIGRVSVTLRFADRRDSCELRARAVGSAHILLQILARNRRERTYPQD